MCYGYNKPAQPLLQGIYFVFTFFGGVVDGEFDGLL